MIRQSLLHISANPLYDWARAQICTMPIDCDLHLNKSFCVGFADVRQQTQYALLYNEYVATPPLSCREIVTY